MICRCTALLIGLLLFVPGRADGQLAIKGELVHTMTGDPIKNGIVLIEGQKITRIVTDASLIPPDYEVITAAVVTPGFIDARSVVGLAGQLNQPHDQDQLETSAPIQPELRAIDAYNPRERLVEWVRGLGVTTLHTGHAPGQVISGQTMIVKTFGNTVDDAMVEPFAMVVATLGEDATGGGGKSPGTRAKVIALLRAELLKAQDYAKKRSDDKPPARDLKKDALALVLERKKPLLVTAHRSHDILGALRLAKEFGFRLIIDGGAEAYLVKDELAAAEVSVILHPPMMRTRGATENATMEAAHLLRTAGIPFAFQSGYESYVPKTRVVLFEAAIAVRYGLSRHHALSALTKDAATLLGIEDRVGTLAPGKDADLALFDGDPFEFTTHCQGVIINGEIASRTIR